jgi:hypothetical protein
MSPSAGEVTCTPLLYRVLPSAVAIWPQVPTARFWPVERLPAPESKTDLVALFESELDAQEWADRKNGSHEVELVLKTERKPR